MSKKHKPYFDSSKPGHIEAMEAATKKAKKLDSAQNKLQEAYEMLSLLQTASEAEAGTLTFAACIQLDKSLPLLKSALKKLDRHSIDHRKLAFTHYLGGAS